MASRIRQETPTAETTAKRHECAVGFTIKSGWSSAVLLSGSALSPQVVDSRRIDLSDPAVPAARQPYHDGFGTARRSGPALARLVSSVERFGGRAVSDAIRKYSRAGHQLSGAGVIVGSMTNPDTIANPHIRIHALEGRLFRMVVEKSLDDAGVPRSVWRDRDVYALATKVLARSEQDIRAAVTALGRGTNGPWRAEEKSAALAAWIILSGGAGSSSRRLELR